MKIEHAKKLSMLPPYIFSSIKKQMLEAYAKKLDVIDLTMGNPDLPVPKPVIERLCDTVTNHPRTHGYPQAKGMPKFRNAVSEWYMNRFNVKLDPASEVLALIGSKEGIANICNAFLNPGDSALVPDPGYLVYYNGVILASGRVQQYPLHEKNNYLPELEKIPEKTARQARLMFLNYPHNPTTAVVEDASFFREVVRFAKKYNIIVVHDNAYSELTFDGYVAPSFLEVEGARDVGVEFHSFSKTFSMAGWRLGFVVGNKSVISALGSYKSYVDFGVSTFIQLAGVIALKECRTHVDEITKSYQQRRDRILREFERIGWHVEKPRATMYLWAKIPEKLCPELHNNSFEFCMNLLKETGLALTPGSCFGKLGEGYVRVSLVTHINRFHDAALRLKQFFSNHAKK